MTSRGRFAHSLPGNSCTHRSGGYSSGYSDGGGGQGAADDIYDIIDSDEEYDVDIGTGSAPQVGPACAIYYCTHPFVVHNQPRRYPSVVTLARFFLVDSR